MGRPNNTKPRRAGTSRRDFFKRSGGAAVALGALPLMQACGGSDDDAPAGPVGANVFQHGVASGDPLADRVILWTRVTQASTGSVSVAYTVATDAALANVVTSGSFTTDAARDYTVKVDASGLAAGTTYYYRFSAAGFNSPVGRTKTLPTGTASNLRIAVVSCSSLAHGFFNAYRRIAERADLDAVVHLGDYIYEYASGEYGNLRAYEPATEIITLTDYRTRHAQYKRDADLQEVHRQHPMVAIWDDHEIANDSWLGGAENHTEATEGLWAARVANGLQAYYEWMPVRVVDPADLRKNNRSFSFGNLVDLVMLEERLTARSQQLGTISVSGTTGFVQAGAYADATRQLLGSTQEQWLATQLRGSTATWKFIGQGVMFSQLKLQGTANAAGGGFFLNPDQWDGYQPARNRVFDVLKGNGSTVPAVNNVVVLTGDIHSSWAADLAQDPNNAVVANGGYDAATGAGSSAVEFVATSITSPGVDDPTNATANQLRSINPHFKYIDLNRRGYMLLDANASRVVCEWWYVDTVAAQSAVQGFGTAFQVLAGTNRLTAAVQTAPRANPPVLAP